MCHARHAPQKNAATTLLFFQIMGADLDGHAARDLAHRLQEWQAAARAGHSLIGNAGRAGLHQSLGLRLVGREGKGGEQQMLRLEHGDLKSEEHTSELQSLMGNSYAVFCLKKKKNKTSHN